MMKIINKRGGTKAHHQDNVVYTINPYNGCYHQCIYCYSTQSKMWTARSKKWGLENTSKAKAKKDIIERFKTDMEYLSNQNLPTSEKVIQIGNMADCYQPLEKDLKITRELLEILTNYQEWEVHVITKSDLILRDIDLLKKIPKAIAEITITTLTHDKVFEPNAPPTTRRFEIIKELSKNNIYVKVVLMPILNDNTYNFTDVNKITQIAKQNGAKDILPLPLNKAYKELSLQDLVKKYNIK